MMGCGSPGRARLWSAGR